VAFADGMRRIDQAIAQRRWTRDDAAALGHAFDTMSPDQRAAVLRTLIPAIKPRRDPARVPRRPALSDPAGRCSRQGRQAPGHFARALGAPRWCRKRV